MQEHRVSSAGIVDRQTLRFQGYDKDIAGIEVLLDFLLYLSSPVSCSSVSNNILYSVSNKSMIMFI